MRIFLPIIIILISTQIFSQPIGVRGFVYDSIEKKPLPYAHIVLSPIPLEDFPRYTTTNEKGYFEFRRIPPGKYSLEITFIGYEKYIDTIQTSWGGKNLDTIYLKQSIINLGEIYVTDRIPQVEQKGDTLEFNAAAFKTAPNSNLEDLILKFPGVEKEENVIKVQGEEVKRVLVDGRRFFGNDPEIALKNLPADIVEKVQLFDKKSEQAELTGFDDDQSEKTFNVVTRVDKRKGAFGKFYGGYGSTDRYNSGLNYNSFNAEERISFLGIANNVNQAGFSTDDLSSSEQITPSPGGRWGRGRGRNQNNPLLNVPINSGEGNNNIYAAGLNYSNIFNQSLELNGSYFFNRFDNRNNTSSSRKYLSEFSGLDSYNEKFSSSSKNFDHRINLFIDYRADSANTFRLRPDIQFSTNKNSTLSFSENFLSNQTLLNSNTFKRQNGIENYDINNDFVYSHRFSKPGRTFSIGINTGFSKRLSDYELQSLNNSFNDSSLVVDSLNQTSDYINKRLNSTFSIAFTEMIDEKSLIRIRFNPQFTNEIRTRDTYKSEPSNYNLLLYDSLYSNSFENQNLALRGSASYRYNSENLNLEFDLMYQHHIRKGVQKFPIAFESINRFNALLPSFDLNYRKSEFQRLRVEYNTRVQIPSITQLQNTIDFSNPNFLRKGNPELNKVIANNLNIRYFITNPEKGTFNAYSINLTYSFNNISNNVIVFTRDTVLSGNIFISKGTQLSYIVNMGNAFFFSTNILNSFKILLLQSNLSFSTNLSYSRTPNLISGQENITKQIVVSENVSLSSNKPSFDYRLNYAPQFSYSINSLNKRINRILIQRANLSLKTNVWDDFYFGTRLNYFYNSGATSTENKSNILLNLLFSYLLFQNKNAELKLEVIDLLNQRKKIDRIIREDYFEDRTTDQLERFVILSFIYNLRTFR